MHPRRLVRPTLVLALAGGCPGPSSTSATGAATETGVTTVSTSAPTEATATQDPTTETSAPTTETPTTGATCVAPEQRCDGEVHQTCILGNWLDDPCPEGSGCEPGATSCQPCDCAAPATCLDTTTLVTCTCLVSEETTCAIGQVCDADAGACVDQLCMPGVPSCAGQSAYQTCNAFGTAYAEPVACPGTQLCDPDDGTCKSACSVVTKRQSSIGCEFWAVDMANAFDQATDIYAVAVSNPSATNAVSVDIYDGNDGGSEQKLLSGVIAPRQVKTFLLSGTANNQSGYYPGDAGFLTSGVGAGRAFRIESNLPIVATQFNPLGGADAFTTDASLLLPTHALGTRYFHLSWKEGLGSGSSLVVVATADDTTVSIRPTVSLAAENGLPALTEGVATEISVGRYDYVQLQSATGDLTGTEIVSDKPVAVFGGHSCGNVPDKATDFCDHLEEQIFSVDTWGREYVALRSPKRADEDMHWRVLARETGATVTFTPKPEGLGNAVQSLPPGGFIEFSAGGDFRVVSDHPILVAGYIYGSSATGLPDTPGDPSMVLMVPVEQWLGDYVFLVDSSYTDDNVRLVRKVNDQNVELGCLGPVPDDRWESIPGTQYLTAVVNIQPGEGECQPGTNTASVPSTTFGIIVVGEALGASYAYPGGMALREIAPQ